MNIDTSKIDKILKKLKHKDPILFRAIQKKITQIAKLDKFFIENHFKNLRHDLSDFKRVQIGSFILAFRIKENTIVFTRFTHHDKAYRR